MLLELKKLDSNMVALNYPHGLLVQKKLGIDRGNMIFSAPIKHRRQLLSRSITTNKTSIAVGLSFSRFLAIFIFYIFPLIFDAFGQIFKLFLDDSIKIIFSLFLASSIQFSLTVGQTVIIQNKIGFCALLLILLSSLFKFAITTL